MKKKLIITKKNRRREERGDEEKEGREESDKAIKLKGESDVKYARIIVFPTLLYSPSLLI